MSSTRNATVTRRLAAIPDYPESLKLAEQHWYAGLRKAGIPEE